MIDITLVIYNSKINFNDAINNATASKDLMSLLFAYRAPQYEPIKPPTAAMMIMPNIPCEIVKPLDS